VKASAIPECASSSPSTSSSPTPARAMSSLPT
jgi:hypothetical protein